MNILDFQNKGFLESLALVHTRDERLQQPAGGWGASIPSEVKYPTLPTSKAELKKVFWMRGGASTAPALRDTLYFSLESFPRDSE